MHTSGIAFVHDGHSPRGMSLSFASSKPKKWLLPISAKRLCRSLSMPSRASINKSLATALSATAFCSDPFSDFERLHAESSKAMDSVRCPVWNRISPVFNSTAARQRDFGNLETNMLKINQLFIIMFRMKCHQRFCQRFIFTGYSLTRHRGKWLLENTRITNLLICWIVRENQLWLNMLQAVRPGSRVTAVRRLAVRRSCRNGYCHHRRCRPERSDWELLAEYDCGQPNNQLFRYRYVKFVGAFHDFNFRFVFSGLPGR